MEQPEWHCKIDEGSAGLVASCWGPDGRHILNTTEFHVSGHPRYLPQPQDSHPSPLVLIIWEDWSRGDDVCHKCLEHYKPMSVVMSSFCPVLMKKKVFKRNISNCIFTDLDRSFDSTIEKNFSDAKS